MWRRANAPLSGHQWYYEVTDGSVVKTTEQRRGEVETDSNHLLNGEVINILQYCSNIKHSNESGEHGLMWKITFEPKGAIKIDMQEKSTRKGKLMI